MGYAKKINFKHRSRAVCFREGGERSEPSASLYKIITSIPAFYHFQLVEVGIKLQFKSENFRQIHSQPKKFLRTLS